MFSYCYVILIIFNLFYTKWKLQTEIFLFHIEWLLPKACDLWHLKLGWSENHVNASMSGLKGGKPVQFSFLWFIVFCFCFVFNIKYCIYTWRAQCSINYGITVELGWVMVKNRRITDFIYVFVYFIWIILVSVHFDSNLKKRKGKKESATGHNVDCAEKLRVMNLFMLKGWEESLCFWQSFI